MAIASRLSFLVIAFGVAALLLVQAADGWSGKWHVGHVDGVHHCMHLIPIVPDSPIVAEGMGTKSASDAATRLADTQGRGQILRIYATYGDSMESVALNLVESLLTAFPVFPEFDSDHSKARLYASQRKATYLEDPWEGSASFDTCDAWSNASAGKAGWEHAANFRRVAADRKNPPFPFRSLCIGLLPVHIRTEKKGGAAGRTAKFGTNVYYQYLARKLYLFGKLAFPPEANANKYILEGSVTPWTLLLDADVQVFPGFFESAAAKTLCPYFHIQCRGVQYRGDCQPFYTLPAESGPHPLVDIYFQRESRKLINTGVAFVDASADGAQCLYREAWRMFRKAKYGDQTSLQAALRKNRGYCTDYAANRSSDAPNNHTTNTNGVNSGADMNTDEGSGHSNTAAVATGGALASAARRLAHRYPLVHSVFPRDEVGATTLNPHRLIAFHAHMSGTQKLRGLLDAHTLMERHLGGHNKPSPKLAASTSVGERLHSGYFLRLEPSALAEPCRPSITWPTSVEIVCAFHRANVAHHNTWGLVFPSQRQLLSVERTVLQISPNSNASSAFGNRPLSSPTPAPTGTLSTNSTAPAAAAIKKKKTKSKAIWAALPALLVIITVTMYHYFVSPAPSDEENSGGGVEMRRIVADERRRLPNECRE